MSKKKWHSRKPAPRMRQTHDARRKPPVILRAYEYEISWEPLPEQPYRHSSPEVKAASARLHALIQDDPRAEIPQLLELIEKYPDDPILYNYLASACMKTGQIARADEVVQKTYERFPDYLFAKLGYGELCMAEGHPEKIPGIFHNKFDLPLLYPERKVFHVSEATGFLGLIWYYFCIIGEYENAENYYSVLQQIAPDHAMTRRLHEFLFKEFPDWRPQSRASA